MLNKVRSSLVSQIRKILVSGLTAILLFVVQVHITVADEEGFATISAVRRAELKNLLLQDCGSCHGMTLQGGLGPALTPDILGNKSRQMIYMTIADGRPGTPMPPWRSLLSEAEIGWLVKLLYDGVHP